MANIRKDKNKWVYSKKVKEHFLNPKNFMNCEEAKEYKADGVGEVGNILCGDVMKVWVKIDKEKNKIKEMRWECYGCAPAIASTSMLSEMVKEKGGMKIEDALKIKPKDIIKRLGGLPSIKAHCSVLGDKALRTAIEDYLGKTKNNS